MTPPEGAGEVAFAVVALVCLFACIVASHVLIWRRIEAAWREIEAERAAERKRDLDLLARLARPQRRPVRGFLAHEGDGAGEPPAMAMGVTIVYFPAGGDDVTAIRERAG